MHVVPATAFDPGFPRGDCAYHSVHVASDGRVYFAIGTHHADTNARIGCFDPAASRFVFVRDIGDAIDEPTGSRMRSHGKVHVPLAEAGGRLYLATMPGAPSGVGGRTDYPGFHILSLDIRSGELCDLVRGPRGQGLVTAIMDTDRGWYYGLTHPGGFYCRYDLGTGSLDVGKRPCFDWQMTGRLRMRPFHPVCRSLGLDAHGAVYGSCRGGGVWRAEPGGSPVRLGGLDVRDALVPPVDEPGRRDGAWRVVVPDRERGIFYGLHRATTSLFRFDPARGAVEGICRLGPRSQHATGHSPDGARLALTLGPNRVLHYISHDPARPVDGSTRPDPVAWLTSYDIDNGIFREHGPLETTAGERVLMAESLAADPHGNLYSLAWVEPVEPAARASCDELRRRASPPLPRARVYQMMLLRIDRAAIAAASS